MARRSPRTGRKPPGRPEARGAGSAAGAGGSAAGGWRSLDPETRAAHLFGLLAGIVATGFFIFPIKVDPAEALALWAAMIGFGVTLAVARWRAADGTFGRLAGGAGALSVFALAAWAAARWHFARFPAVPGAPETVAIPSAGRDGVMAFHFFAFAFALGLALGSLERPRAAIVWRTFRHLLILAAFGFALLGLYQFFIGYERMLGRLRETMQGGAAMDPLMLQSLEHALSERRVGGTLGNGNVYAAWLAVLAALCLSLTGTERRLAFRAAGAAGYALVVFALLLTGSRGGMLTLLVSTAWALALLQRGGAFRASGGDPGEGRAARAAPMAALLIGAGLSLMARSAWAVDVGYRLSRITTIRERLNYWTVAVKVWSKHVWIGGGPGSFELYYPMLKSATARESRFAHSWIFQAGAELGLVGLGLYLVFWASVGLAVWSVWRRLSRVSGEGNEEAKFVLGEANWLALVCGVLAFNGLFEYALQTPEFLALLGLASGGLMGLAAPRPSAGIAPSPVLRARLACTAGLAVIGLAVSLWLIPRAQWAAEREWKAQAAALGGDPQTAADEYARAARLFPWEEGYLVRRSGALLQLPGRADEAEALLVRAEEMNPLSARIRAERAKILERGGRTDLAAKKLDEAVALYPADAGYRLQRARVRHALGRYDEARQDLRDIESMELPVWEYLRPDLDALRETLGLGPTRETLKEREKAEALARKRAREAGR